VKPGEFVRRVKKVARMRGLTFRLEPYRGKGGHQTLRLDGRQTIVAFHGSGHEVPKGTLHAMLRAIGLTLDDLYER
jgi:predicted RNA binding protein YcfA (HicA-like mRNA interferase family)